MAKIVEHKIDTQFGLLGRKCVSFMCRVVSCHKDTQCGTREKKDEKNINTDKHSTGCCLRFGEVSICR